jgi:DNA-binding NarL/FixJ family response regulator
MKEWLTQPEAFQKVLTNRELGVLHCLTEGQSDPEIGKHLGISVETVAGHRKSLRRKLNVHDDRSLMAYGREWGVFGAGE